MEFTESNYELAEKVIKDILYMYVDILDSKEITHDIYYGSFDALEHVDSKTINLEGYDIDISLINEGSAIKILCIMFEHYDQFETLEEVYNSEYFLEIKELIQSGKLDHIPKLKKVIELAYTVDEFGLSNLLIDVYQEYVVGYFKRILEQ